MTPYVVYDCETARSADACRQCFSPVDPSPCPKAPDGHHVSIGWKDYYKLGLSVGCYYSSIDEQHHVFDAHTLPAFVERMVQERPLLVTYNGVGFDGPLIHAVLDDRLPWATVQAWDALMAESYDILAEIWRVDPANQYTKGNSLDMVSPANGYGKKALTGASAPGLWAAGRYAEVVDYCLADVWKTQQLLLQAAAGTPIQRGGGLHPVLLLKPDIWGLLRRSYYGSPSTNRTLSLQNQGSSNGLRSSR